ncbi:hypothetical protein C9374_009198 [Naegleria lovaniensis]|uniref:Calcineurin-like phosphoesterase domain-containing protein n=1 Tax=Naegleria lovaniensis TaxID=51637 RepID=A0AA88KEP5_NAELO|nr:uncharacterized protein C9374_009198 [Naegleria lovaniensis]KAG2377682.1 hypothetical protein C9374_009198 [Naegleria lovaniensis]
MEATRRKIAQVCQKNDKLIFLDHELGHDEHLYQCPETGGVVKLGDKTLTINDTIQMHENFVNKLKTMAFDEACEYAICVLTHHAPYLENTVLEDEKPLETAMGTDLSYLFQKRSNITFWGFGHTHRNARISLPNKKSEGGKTILATNQLGYILKLGLEKIKYEQTKDGESAVATSQLGKEVENTDLPYSNDVVFRIPLLRTNTQCNSSKSIYHGE